MVAFYTGFRMPGLWSINYYIPSWFDGFYRRSLLGTILFVFGDLRFNYHFIAAIQFAVLFALIAQVMTVTARSSSYFKVLMMLFILGPAGGYLFDDVGYADQVLYLILLYVLQSRNQWVNLMLIAGSLLVHEMAAFTIVPIYLTSLILVKRDHRTAIRHGIVALLVFAIIYLFFQKVGSADILKLMGEIKDKAAYPLRDDYFDVFRVEFTGERMAWYYRGYVFDLAAALLISTATAAVWLEKGASAATNAMRFATAFLAVAAPLFLGVFGWDTDRWIFLSTCSGLIIFGLRGEAVSPVRFVWVGFFSLLFVTHGHLAYFDGLSPRSLYQYREVSAFIKALPQQIATIPSH